MPAYLGCSWAAVGRFQTCPINNLLPASKAFVYGERTVSEFAFICCNYAVLSLFSSQRLSGLCRRNSFRPERAHIC